MSLRAKLEEIYPELVDYDFAFGAIKLVDDGDGIQYIAKWEYNKPLPEGFKLGK